MNGNWIWMAIGAVVILAIIALIAAGLRRSRTESLRQHFGREYDRAVKTTGSRTAAEEALIARAQEARSFEIRELTAAERDDYAISWKKIETHFIERPAMAVAEADELIRDAMRTRGYPIADFEKYAALLSVKHPRLVEHYRAGHRAIEARAVSTEDLRQAMLHYRALFEDLIGARPTDVASEIVTSREVAPPGTVAEPLRRDEERPRR